MRAWGCVLARFPAVVSLVQPPGAALRGPEPEVRLRPGFDPERL